MESIPNAAATVSPRLSRMLAKHRNRLRWSDVVARTPIFYARDGVEVLLNDLPSSRKPVAGTHRKASSSQCISVCSGLEKFAEERHYFIRDADDLVRCLTIKLEIELGLRLAIVPVAECFEFTSPQRALRQGNAPGSDAHTRCLRLNAALLGYFFGGGDGTTRDQPMATLILAGKHKKRVTFGDMFTAIHGLLCDERERFRGLIADLGFYGERHAFSCRTLAV